MSFRWSCCCITSSLTLKYVHCVCLCVEVENTIRWRYARDENGGVKYDVLGNQEKESNARVVRWSDGRYAALLCTLTLN